MSKQPWMKWYPADWRSDPGLRMCSFAARGLWADLLSLMHEAEPYGHLLINGVSPNTKQLAFLVGGAEREIGTLLSELEAAGVFSRAATGEVMSRRMVRDAKKREEDKANGKKGGNPSLKEGVNPPIAEEDKAQKLEARTSSSSLRSEEATDVSARDAKPPPPEPLVSPDEEYELKLAAGQALSASPNLFVMATPMAWKRSGFGWLLDVLPAVRAVAPRLKSGSIQTWDYYTPIIADWHAKRTAKMPQGSLNRGSGNAPRSTTASLGRQVAEEFRRRESERGDGSNLPAVVELSRAG